MSKLQNLMSTFPPLSDCDHCRGSLNANILLMEYGDFCCPQSSEAHVKVKTLQQQLGNQICLIFRYFPQPEKYPQALKAAKSAEAAAAQNKFWEMHDLLFEHQSPLEDWNFVEFSVQLNLDSSQFLKDVTGDSHLSRIESDINSGRSHGVRETPTFFIGIRHQGAHNLEELMVTLLQAIQRYQAD